MTSEDVARHVQAATVAAVVTTLQHIYLADRDDIPREARYALGVGGILAGFAVWAMPAQRHDAMTALLAATAGAALAPVIGYAARRATLRRRYGRPTGG